MATQTNNSFADTIAARTIAFCLAVLLGASLFYNYKEDFTALFSGKPEAGLPVTSTETAPDQASNPALAECLQQRIGDVDRMKEEGILSDSQYASFRTRAEELCVQQHSN